MNTKEFDNFCRGTGHIWALYELRPQEVHECDGKDCWPCLLWVRRN